MITLRWLLCLILIQIFLHLLIFAGFGVIALWSLGWWIKTIAVGIVSVPIANWIVGD
jgi:hypothetical protein